MFKMKSFLLFFLFFIFFAIHVKVSPPCLYLNPANSPLPAESGYDHILPFLAEAAEFESNKNDDFTKLQYRTPLLHTAHVEWLFYANHINIFKHLTFPHILPRSPPTLILPVARLA